MAISFQGTFLLTSDEHSALEPEKDKRTFDQISAFPALKAQCEQKQVTADTELGGAVRRMQYISKERTLSRPLVLGAGDFLSGTLWFKAFKGVLDVKVMNLMQYDAVAIGNHDFDLGWEHLKTVVKEAQFPILCANVFEKEKPIFKPYEIYEVEGKRKVCVIGIMGKDAWAAIGKDKKEQLELRSPNKTLRRLLEELPPVDYKVLLSHSGITKDRRFAAKFQQINAILGGHTHIVTKRSLQHASSPFLLVIKKIKTQILVGYFVKCSVVSVTRRPILPLFHLGLYELIHLKRGR